MRITLWIALLVALITVVFALQNPGYTDLKLGPWTLQASIALILIVTFAVGVLVGSLAMLPGRLRQRRQTKKLERTVKELEPEQKGDGENGEGEESAASPKS